jgi:hypothetical protein
MGRTESRLRDAQRSGDGVALLRAKLHAGELTEAHVVLASSLGHTAARELDPVPLVDWAGRQPRRDAIGAARDLLDETLPARVAADWAERVLPVWEAEHPDDGKPRKAIEAARASAACPAEKPGHLARPESADMRVGIIRGIFRR